jgi:hypothetical protein
MCAVRMQVHHAHHVTRHRTNHFAGAIALSIEEPASSSIPLGKGFTVAYACGGAACASAKYILKVAALQPLMSKPKTGNNDCADQRQCSAHVVGSIACEALSVRLRKAWKVGACVA